MSKSFTRDKKLIRVPSDIIAELSKAAVTVGKSFYDYTAEALEQVVRAHKLGCSPVEVVDFYELMRIQKNAGLVMIFSDTLDYLISKLYLEEKEDLLQKWYDTGVWYGKYLQAKFHSRQPVEMLEKLLSVTLWDVNEIELSKENDGITLRCVSFTLSVERTKLLTSFLEGIMYSMGYETSEKDVIRGIIRMKLKVSKREKTKKTL